MNAVRAAISLLALALVTLLTAPADAKSPLRLDAALVLGPSTPVSEGWMSVSVRLENASDSQLSGTIQLHSRLLYSSDDNSIVTEAPFAIVGKGRVTVLLPTHGFMSSPPALSVRAVDAEGNELAKAVLADPRPLEPLLFDLSVPSRIAPSLRGKGVAVPPGGRAWGGHGMSMAATSSPQLNPATGEPILPRRPAAYSSVTVVLAKSEQLARLPAEQLTALGDWVLGGGTLAVVVTRPEDLRGPPLSSFAGAEVSEARVPADLPRGRSFAIADDPASGSPYAPGPTSRFQSAAPSASVAAELVGYTGGNLRDSRWGASATYGLGELHLLAFDATRDPFVSDPWVQLSMLDLMRHAWQRADSVALPHGQVALDHPQIDEIRRQLDPNESTRWTIAVSALLLLIYAVLAGPVNFYLASRKGKPLRALLHLPIWAAAMLALIVLLGMLGKGVEGRARHLTLIEAGAGMPRAATTRFRGFYAASSDRLTVRASDRGNVLDVAGSSGDTPRTLVVDRDGARLASFQAKPWQTVVVREDGFSNIAGGISLVEDSAKNLVVVNRTARDLVGVVVKLPSGDLFFHDRIADGARVQAAKGTRLPRGHSSMVAGRSIFPLNAKSFAKHANRADSGLGTAYQALESYVPHGTDWWPSDVPALIAELDGGEGRTTDSGLRVDVDRALVRVVGWGGVP